MRVIDGSTRLAGIVGSPLAHSLSPAMHNAAFEHLGLNWVYVPFAANDEAGLRRLFAAAPSLDLVGLNVTMPYKHAAVDLCDEVATAARIAGAVNTVHCDEGRLVGYNTDGRGLLESLELEAGFSVADTHVVILGAGGAAAGVLVALMLAHPTSITVAARDPHKATELIERMAPHAGGVALEAVELGQAEPIVSEASLVLNATPIGMRPGDPSPVPEAWLRSGQVVYDMVYGTQRPTALVTEAEAVGARAFDGLGMLVCQGAIALDTWMGTGERAPREIMRSAAEAALARRRSRD